LEKGGTGVVFRGTDKKSGNRVAVKTLSQSGHSVFHHEQMVEVEVHRKVNHENIANL
jgi:serine/threonine protein kinase